MKYLYVFLIASIFEINAKNNKKNSKNPVIIVINNKINGQLQSQIKYSCKKGTCEIILDPENLKRSFERLPQDKKMIYFMSLSLEERKKLKEIFTTEEQQKYFIKI